MLLPYFLIIALEELFHGCLFMCSKAVSPISSFPQLKLLCCICYPWFGLPWCCLAPTNAVRCRCSHPLERCSWDSIIILQKLAFYGGFSSANGFWEGNTWHLSCLFGYLSLFETHLNYICSMMNTRNQLKTWQQLHYAVLLLHIVPVRLKGSQRMTYLTGNYLRMTWLCLAS